VASVRETLLNLTSRLGLVDIFSAADRNAWVLKGLSHEVVRKSNLFKFALLKL
jgi:hypothetical protein